VNRLLAGRDLVQELRLAGKMTLAGTLAWWVSSELGAHRPIFATLVPLVAMTGDPFSAVSVSVDRIVGVFAGVGIGIALVHLSLSPTLVIGIGLLLGTTVGMILRVGSRANVQPAVSILFMLGVAGSSQVGVARVWETSVGAAITVVVSALLWPPDPVRELRHRLERLRQELAADLVAVAQDLATGDGAAGKQLAVLREHSLDAVRDVFELDNARRALRWSPLRRRDVPKVEELIRRISLAARLYRHARAVARDVADANGLVAPRLAAATRDIADAADRALAGADPSEPLERADGLVVEPMEGEEAIVASQLRQLLADLRTRAR